jgi:putative membrane protein
LKSVPTKTTPRNRWIGALTGVAAIAAILIGLAVWRPTGLYPWLKALHVIAVMAWMAGMLYLPRLFVYHCEAEPGSRQSETFKVMERRLLRAIIDPAMVVSWAVGLWLAYEGNWLSSRWFLAKLGLVAVLSGMHGLMARWTADFAADRNQHDHRFFRIMNEIPTVLMIGIVILVVVKPF